MTNIACLANVVSCLLWELFFREAMIVKGATESPTFYSGLFLSFNPVIFNSYFLPIVAKAFAKLFL